jgi:ABC-2 type transport system ATP-binding protein
VAIIHHGRLVAQGSLEELRAGVEAQALAASAGSSSDGASRDIASAGKLTLEEIFLRIVGGTRQEQELSWLG